MILTDFLCLHSCLNIFSVYGMRREKEILYVQRSVSALDALAVSVMKMLGWSFTPFNYELSPSAGSSGNIFLEINDRLLAFVKDVVTPAIKKKIYCLKSVSDHEKERFTAYLSWIERRRLYRSFEILSLLENMTKAGSIGEVRVMLLSSQWDFQVRSVFRSRGFDAAFYKVRCPVRAERRHGYCRDAMFSSAVERCGTAAFAVSLVKALSGITVSLFYRLRRLIAGNRYSLGLFDVGIILPGYDRTKYIGDMHWKEDGPGRNLKTIAFVYKDLDKVAYDDFAGKADMRVALTPRSKSPYYVSMYFWLWPEYPKLFLRRALSVCPDLIRNNINMSHAAIILSVLDESCRLETMFDITGIRLFWSSVEGNSAESVAGAIAIRRKGGVSLGSSWSVYSFPGFSAQRHTNDVFFGWGPWHAVMLIAAGSLCRTIVTCGYPASMYIDEFAERGWMLKSRISDKSGKKIICLYDNYFARDGEFCNSLVIEYINAILDWVGGHDNIDLIVKSKRKNILELYKETISASLSNLEKEGRVHYEFEKGDLAPGLASDLTLGIGLATLPCLIGSLGKKVILLDVNSCPEQPRAHWGRISFIKNPKEIINALGAWLSESDDKTPDVSKMTICPEPNSANYFVDIKSAQRIGGYMFSLYSFLRKGLGADAAIEKANEAYSREWGSETIATEGKKFSLSDYKYGSMECRESQRRGVYARI